MNLPPLLDRLARRVGHDDAAANARAELDLARDRARAADDLLRRLAATGTHRAA